MRFERAGTLTSGEYFDVVVRAVRPLVHSNPGYFSHFAYIRNGVSRTNPGNLPDPKKIRRGEQAKPLANLHPMNTDGSRGFMGQINMFSDAEKGVTESVFEFSYELHNKTGVLVDDKQMLFKMAFVDFDEDRRQSVTETFCVNLDELDIESTDISDWDRVPHASGEPRFFLPGFEQFGGEDGSDLTVELQNNTCNWGAGKSLKVTSVRVGFLCDNPEKYDEFYTARGNKLKIPGWIDKKHCKECFSRKNAGERCRGPRTWTVAADGSITEDLSSAGKDWQYYPGHPEPADFGKCEHCKKFDPPCYSVQKCQQNFMNYYNNPYAQPWKRSVMLAFKKPKFQVTYGIGCKNVGQGGTPYKDPRKETCDRNFQFTCSTWKCLTPFHPIHNPAPPTTAEVSSW